VIKRLKKLMLIFYLVHKETKKEKKQIIIAYRYDV